MILSLFLLQDASILTANDFYAAQRQKQTLSEVGVNENLGSVVDGTIQLTRENGVSISLEEALSGKPVILNLVYFECPMLCGLVLNGLTESLKKLSWTPGNEFDVITVSIDPNETPELAAQNRQGYLKELNKRGAEQGWHFYTASQEAITALTSAVGFQYTYDELAEQYAHPAVLTFLSPDLKISRYLYGITYDEIQLKKALDDATNGKIGTTMDRIMLYCYQFDPSSNSYVPLAKNIMKLGGVVIMVSLGMFLGLLWLKEKRFTSNPSIP